VKKTKGTLGWPSDKFFYVPEEAQKNWDTVIERGAKV
jgi:transketolase